MMNEKLGKYKIALDNAIFGGKDFIRIQQKINDLETKMEAPAFISKDEGAEKLEAVTASHNKNTIRYSS
ncbi:MAG: hypothetical protein IPF54_26525 [Draconibacterium sp.]|nr:hypothetical protein [Draconibacterium sp.]